MWSSARCASSPISSQIIRRASYARSWTNRATSVATWSLRERAVCSRPPTGPAISVRRRSIAMWMSSSSAANGKLPSLSSRSAASSPSSSAARSASVMTPRAASIRACARDCATSYGHRRRSKASELLSARKRSSCGSEKRDTELRLDGRKPVGDLGALGGQSEAEQVQRRRPAEPRGLRRAVEAPLGVAHLLEDDRHEARDAPEHEQPWRPARDQIAEPEMEPRRDLADRLVR